MVKCLLIDLYENLFIPNFIKNFSKAKSVLFQSTLCRKKHIYINVFLTDKKYNDQHE